MSIYPDDDSFHESLSGRVASPEAGGTLSPIGLADAPGGENVVAVRESFKSALQVSSLLPRSAAPAGVATSPGPNSPAGIFAPDAGAGEI